MTKKFNEIKAVDGLNLNVERNSIYGFLGPNGAGKTTTIKLLLGLLRPSEGKINLFGENLIKNSLKIRRSIGYLPQNPKFYDFMTPVEILEYVLKFYFEGPQQVIEDRIEMVLDLVSLDDKRDRIIRGFSGGERQRLGIAQAMINFPDLLILDEPAASLDPIGRRDVLNIMDNLRDYTTIFYSTHILDDVQRVSDKVAILNRGQLVAEGDIDAILAGNDGIVYDVAFKGGDKNTLKRISDIDWVSDINASSDNGYNKWIIGVEDEEKAETHLLRYLLEDKTVKVIKFNKKEYELEDVFISLMEEN